MDWFYCALLVLCEMWRRDFQEIAEDWAERIICNLESDLWKALRNPAVKEEWSEVYSGGIVGDPELFAEHIASAVVEPLNLSLMCRHGYVLTLSQTQQRSWAEAIREVFDCPI